MRAAVISDVHIDVNKDYNVVEEIVKYLEANEIELLLIAGDISSYPEQSIEAVDEIERNSKAKVLYVPGNHDMWNKDGKYPNNDVIYEMFCKDSHCLSGKVFETEDYVIIGDVAWYDYSFGRTGYSRQDFEKMSWNDRVWHDSLFNTWSKDNEYRCNWFLETFEELMKKYADKKMVFMTHMLSHEAFTVPEQHLDWGYFNAFLGSRKLQELCEKYKPAYAICGHVHFRKSFTQNGVRWMCRCLNYYNEWRDNDDVSAQIADAMEIIEI